MDVSPRPHSVTPEAIAPQLACHSPEVIEQAMHLAANAMFLADQLGRIGWVNVAFSRLYGYDPEEVLGKTPSVLKSGRQSTAFYQELWQTIKAGRVWRGQLSNRCKNGAVVDTEQTITPICDERGEISHFFVIYEDITDRLRSEQHLIRLAMVDSITGLPNRNQFEDRLANALTRSRRSGKPMASMMIDLDHFKAANDTLGHAGGDELLGQIGRCMRSTLRDTDVIARLSGDEFAVLIEDLARPEQAIESAQRIVEALAIPFCVSGAEVRVGASIGIAVSGEPDDSPEDLMRKADLAMYQAKSRGRGRLQFFDATMDQAARRRYETREMLRKALREDRLRIAYQPQVDMRTGKVTGAEALLRLEDPVHGEIPASEFIDIAEQDGLILAVNDWVLQHAFAQIAALHATVSPMVSVAINLSAGQFDRTDLARNIGDLLKRFSLPASAIRLELTETVMLRSSMTVHENLRALSRMGVLLSIDDFGTGHSSLPALREFPIQGIKLDISYVRGIGRSQRDEGLLRAFIGIAQHLNLDIVAEGVETLAQRDFLVREGCTRGQGHLYSRALAKSDFAAWMKAGCGAAPLSENLVRPANT